MAVKTYLSQAQIFFAKFVKYFTDMTFLYVLNTNSMFTNGEKNKVTEPDYDEINQNGSDLHLIRF